MIDPEGAPLELIKANGFDVLAPVKSVPAPREKVLASNIDTEGELAAAGKTGNSEHTLGIRLFGFDEKEFRERQVQFEQKLHKLDGEEGGVLRVIFPDDGWIDWEIRGINGGERLIDNRFVHHMRSQDEVTFVCAPFGEGREELVGEFEGEDRALECVIPGVGGSVEALARAEIVSPNADVWDLKWGRDARQYSDAETAKARYSIADLTPLGGATHTTATVDGKAGTAVLRQGTLTPNWTAIASTQLGAGHMTHTGIFEVLVWVHMPPSNTGQVEICFEYGVGDGRRTPLAEVAFGADHLLEGKVLQLSLGQMFIRAARQGAHFWEGKVLARSSIAGDDLDLVGDFVLRPLSEGRGEVSIKPTLQPPAALITRDEFNQSAGNLHGKVIAQALLASGPRSPGTVANDAAAGAVPWSSPSNAQTSNNSRATAKLTSGANSQTQWLKATNFGFNIPEGATINGIVTELERSYIDEGTPPGGGIFPIPNPPPADWKVHAVKGGVIGSTNPPSSGGGSFPLNDTYASYGAPSFLWGTTWTPAQINATGFGVAYRAIYPGPYSTTVCIDHVRITVYYTTASGETWSTTGDATDLAVETAGRTAQRSEVSDANIETGRYAIAGAQVFTDTVVGIKRKRSSLAPGAGERIRSGVLARYVNTNNWLWFGNEIANPSSPISESMRVVKRVSGTVTELGRVGVSALFDAFRYVWLHVDRRGRYFCWAVLSEGGTPMLLMAGQDNDLAAGGALDDGTNGFYDAKTGANANTRNYDDFVAWIPPLDAAIFQGLSLHIAHDGVEREVLGGGDWSRITPSGDYLRLAPKGMEGRKNRLVFIASPNDPDTMGVGFPSLLKVAVYARRRYRTIPDPA